MRLPSIASLGIIKEIDVKDPQLQRKVNEFADLSNKIDKLKVELKSLSKKYEGIADELIPLLEQASDNSLKTEKFLVFIKRKGYERERYGYKDAFNWLFDRVNPAMKKIVNEALEATKTLSKVAPVIASQKNEGISDVWLKIRNFIRRITGSIRRSNRDVQSANTRFESMLSKLQRFEPEVVETSLSAIAKGVSHENKPEVIKEKAPPGMEDVVLRLKKDPDIDNPYAVAWAMYNRKHGKK